MTTQFQDFQVTTFFWSVIFMNFDTALKKNG